MVIASALQVSDEKLMLLQQELIQKAQSKEAYDEIADEIFRLRELASKPPSTLPQETSR